eukprot:COSAG02_NODE_785_length_17228_cov_24.082141_14_plen_155_part_00
MAMIGNAMRMGARAANAPMRVAMLRPAAMAVAARPAAMRFPVAVQVQARGWCSSPVLSAGDDLHSAAADATYISKGDAEQRVMAVVKDFGKVDPAKVTGSSDFVKDLGLDSLDTVELVMAFEEEFMVELDDADAEKIETVPQAVEFFSTHPMAK